MLNSDWKEYPYRGIPVDLRQMPPLVAPYQLHFDWQMWFASMAGLNEYPWTIHLVWKLLHGDPLATQLFARNPFPDAAPRFVRVAIYGYRFTDVATRRATGAWWSRELLGTSRPFR